MKAVFTVNTRTWFTITDQSGGSYSTGAVVKEL